MYYYDIYTNCNFNNKDVCSKPKVLHWVGCLVWLLLCQHKLESSGKEGVSLRRLLHQMVCRQGRKGTLLVDDYWGRAQPSRAVPVPSRWAGGQCQPWAAV